MHNFSKLIATTGAFAGLFLSSSAFAGHNDKVVYQVMPADEGNVWIFDKVENKTSHGIEIVEFVDSAYAGNGWYASTLAGIFGQGVIPFWDHYYGDIAWTHAGDYNWTQIIDVNAPLNSTWQMDAGPCKTYDVERIGGATVNGPTGEFANPWAYNFYFMPDENVRCADAPVQQVSFAEGVGPVQMHRADSVSDLLFARVDGEVVAQGPGQTEVDANGVALTVALVSDALVQPHPIYCFTTPCPQPSTTLRFAMILENLGSSTQTFGFDYDNDGTVDADTVWEFDIFDERNNYVGSYSDQFTGPDEIEAITLAPGEREVVLLEMPAVTNTGALLEGNYQGVAIFRGAYADRSGFSKLDVNFTVARN